MKKIFLRQMHVFFKISYVVFLESKRLQEPLSCDFLIFLSNFLHLVSTSIVVDYYHYCTQLCSEMFTFLVLLRDTKTEEEISAGL